MSMSDPYRVVEVVFELSTRSEKKKEKEESLTVLELFSMWMSVGVPGVRLTLRSLCVDTRQPRTSCHDGTHTGNAALQDGKENKVSGV